MKKARTTNFTYFRLSRWLLMMGLILGTSSISEIMGQCDLRLFYNGSDVTGSTNFIEHLDPGECEAIISLELVIDIVAVNDPNGCTPYATSVYFADGTIDAMQDITDYSGPFPIGTHTVQFHYYDENGTIQDYSLITINVEEYPNAITALACNDNVQVSLDENCSATISPDMILEGGPYGCYDNYIVRVRAGGPNGPLIDRDANVPGVQIDGNDFGNCYTTQVFDPATGNSCWGRICIEDKFPPVIACSDTAIIVECGESTHPDVVGIPAVSEPCGTFTLTYVDEVDDLGCDDRLGRAEVITRTWIATDESGNQGTCEEMIWVLLGDLDSVMVPPSRDDIDLPALECDEKYDPNKDISAHILDFPFCVDGYLLDSAYWVSTGGTPQGGDLSGQRRPKVLGWNCLPSGPYAGHPSPDNIMYEPHPQWQFTGVCWGPDELVKWEGTGYPFSGDCANINYTYSDTRIDLSDPNCNAGDVGCYKILRKWVILDWCTGEVREDYQVIKVLDKEGPVITYPDEIEVGMTNGACFGLWNVAPPWITDNCSEEIHYEIFTTAGDILGNEDNGYTVVNIPPGTHTARIIAHDCCGQTTQHDITLRVIDNVPPVAICEDRTVVSLTGNPANGFDQTKLCAESLDNGSYDNCADVHFKVIRMDALLGTANGSFADNTVECGGADGDDDAIQAGNQVYFDDCAFFCCEDVGEVIMVVLRVFDVDPGAGPVNPSRMSPGGRLSGHFTDCMVEVAVQDKSNPIVVAPPDIVVSCMFWFDDSEDALSDPDNTTFGRVVTNVNDRQKVKTIDQVCEQYCISNNRTGYTPSQVQNGLACDFYNSLHDPAHPNDKYELVWGFDGYVISTCGSDFDIRIIDNRECGQGEIIREVSVTRGNSVYRDRQSIWVVDCDPFHVSEECTDPDDHIQWPLNCVQPRTLDGCGQSDTSPDNPQLGRPELVNGGDDNCSMIIIDYKDDIYVLEPDACFKIIRTWIVIDWCQYDPTTRGDEGRWEYTQVIKVLDRNDPVVTCIVGDCEPAEKDSLGVCQGHISLTVDPEDQCTPDDWLNYEYKIDLFNDGDYNAFSGPARPGQTAQNFDNPYADDETNSTEATGTYPIGTHRITWYIEDGCGNVGICDTLFEVKDCKRPTPYCKTGIITVVMPSTGSITVWANDLDAGSFDNCTEQEDLIFYFNGDSSWTGYEINCDTFINRGANGSVQIEVQMWVEDEEGNADYCTTIIEVQDPNEVCEGTSNLPAIAGSVFTEDLMYVENVEVDLQMNGNPFAKRVTGRDGHYAFMNLSAGNGFTVDPLRDDNYLNGVSTADLVKIQRHLLGKEELDSPYKVIAADVNNTQSISAGDISELRKLILGIFNELDDVDSWRFVPVGHSFEDVSNPWFGGGFPEVTEYNDLQGQRTKTDFYGIKMGDVTGDAKPNGALKNVTRNSEAVVLSARSSAFKAGEEVVLTFEARELIQLSGYQFTLEYDDEILEAVDFVSEGLELDASNFGFIGSGMITTSWNDFGTRDLEGALFSIVFTAKAGGELSESVLLSSKVTRAEAYDANLDGMPVKLAFEGQEAQGEFELYQNVPNPFTNNTQITFDLPTDMPATVTIYSAMGKVVRIIPVDGQRGQNMVTVSQAELTGSGILYYQLDAGRFTATRKMILMN